MANPTISSRPNKTISSYNSKWVAAGGRLPVEYQIANTKFPDNTEDSDLFVNSVADNGGFARFATTPNHGLSVGQFVRGFGFTTEDSYNNVYEVIEVNSVSQFTANLAFVSNDNSGELINYYNNYAIEVEVYAGINAGHPHAAEDPISLIGTIKQIPDANNIARVDIGQYIKTKMNSEYDSSQTSWPNDLNAWTDFYIEYREIFDGSTTTFIDDSSNLVGRAAYNTLQFGNTYGGNLYGFVLEDDINAPVASFLTEANPLTKFNGIDFEVSLISEEDSFEVIGGFEDTYNIASGGAINTLDVSTEETNLTGFYFKPDGLKLYVLGESSDQIHEYVLSEAFNINSATLNTSESIVANPQDMFINPDGMTIYVLYSFSSTSFLVKDYPLSTAWDLSTIGAETNRTQNNLALYSGDYDSINCICFNDDGTRLIVAGEVSGFGNPDSAAIIYSIGGANAYRADLASPLLTVDIDNGTAYGQEQPRGIWKPPSNQFLYLAGTDGSLKKIDYSNEDTFGSVAQSRSLDVRDIQFSADGTKMYLASASSITSYAANVGSTNYSGDGYGVYRIPVTTNEPLTISAVSGNGSTEEVDIEIDDLQ